MRFDCLAVAVAVAVVAAAAVAAAVEPVLALVPEPAAVLIGLW